MTQTLHNIFTKWNCGRERKAMMNDAKNQPMLGDAAMVIGYKSMLKCT